MFSDLRLKSSQQNFLWVLFYSPHNNSLDASKSQYSRITFESGTESSEEIVKVSYEHQQIMNGQVGDGDALCQ